MIKPISFTTNYNLKKTPSSPKTVQHKSIYQQSPISFSGIMDNPEAKRITDANGNTYIVETGGTIVIHNKDKENPKGVNETLTGVGVGAVGTSAIKSKSQNNQSTTNQDDINPHEIQKSETDNDINTTELPEEDNSNPDYGTEIDDDIDIDNDIDDDDDSIFDDSSPIYEF